MTNHKQFLSLAFAVSSACLCSNVFAHANYVENPVDGSRTYKENARHFLKLNLAHTCGHGGVNYDIIHSGVIFPNAADAVITQYSAMTATGEPDKASIKTTLSDLVQVLQTYDANKNPAGANALMSIKPILNSNWEKILMNKDTVPAFYNHGVNTRDVRSIQWLNSKNPAGVGYGMSNDYAENLEFVTTLGKLQNCVAKVRVYTPSIDLCTDGNAYLWGMNYTPVVSEALVTASGGKIGVSTNYAPYIDIVRNTTTNPLESSCGAGQMVTIYPSATDIDNYLGKYIPIWNSSSTSPSSSTQCPAGQHFMNGACMDNNAM